MSVTPAAKPPGDATSTATEFAVPLALIGIVLMMVLPLPGFLIDVMLALSLAVSIGVFLIGLFMEHALEFSAFPAVILVATLLRLSLNVATTRLILLKGHEGHGAAGRVVEAFGRFVVGRQRRRRPGRVPDPGGDQLRRDHQGRWPRRRGRGALCLRRHAGQADGDRRRI